MKICMTCKTPLPLENFSKLRKSSDGLQRRCKACSSQANRKNYHSNIEKQRERARRKRDTPEKKKLENERTRQYYLKNPEARKITHRKYYAANKEKISIREKQKRKDMPDVGRQYSAKYKSKNKEAITLRQRAYYVANREECNKRTKQWKIDHPVEFAMQWLRRRAAKKKAPGKMTASEWKYLCDFYGNICLKCGEEGNLSVDHIIPITCPGTSNFLDNIQPLCRRCNTSKNNRVIDYRPDKSCVSPYFPHYAPKVPSTGLNDNSSEDPVVGE